MIASDIQPGQTVTWTSERFGERQITVAEVNVYAGGVQLNGIDENGDEVERQLSADTSVSLLRMVDVAELTRRFGLPAHEQSAVASWTGDPYGTTWTEEQADQLHQAWEADQLRLDVQGG